jgi:hypothetical protein
MFSKVSADIGFVIFMVNVFAEVWKTLYAANGGRTSWRSGCSLVGSDKMVNVERC